MKFFRQASHPLPLMLDWVQTHDRHIYTVFPIPLIREARDGDEETKRNAILEETKSISWAFSTALSIIMQHLSLWHQPVSQRRYLRLHNCELLGTWPSWPTVHGPIVFAHHPQNKHHANEYACTLLLRSKKFRECAIMRCFHLPTREIYTICCIAADILLSPKNNGNCNVGRMSRCFSHECNIHERSYRSHIAIYLVAHTER